jgi:hypothetical protein
LVPRGFRLGMHWGKGNGKAPAADLTNARRKGYGVALSESSHNETAQIYDACIQMEGFAAGDAGSRGPCCPQIDQRRQKCRPSL